MLQIGAYNLLKESRRIPAGVLFTDGEEEALLPKKYLPQDHNPEIAIEVFVYLDNENRPVASTLRPKGIVGDFVFLEVKELNKSGAFLDWGIDKDLFVAYSEQRTEMQLGNSYIVYIFIDEYSGRISGTSRWMKYLQSPVGNLESEQEVQLLICEQTDLGYKAIINNQFEGLIFKNEVFELINTGDIKRGFIKQVRADGKVDLSLQMQGTAQVDASSLLILDKLKSLKGVLPLGDKSSPEEIYNMLGMSKKVFKKAVGGLYKRQMIAITDFETRLLFEE